MTKIKFLLAAIFLVALSFTISGQTTISNIEARIKTFPRYKKFKVTYDKFKDETTVMVMDLELFYSTSIYPAFRFKGQTLEGPIQDFYFIFHVENDDWTFVKNRNLIIFVDDKDRIDLGASLSYTGDRGKRYTSYVWEEMSYRLSREQFEKIVRAKNVESQLNTTEGKWKTEQLKVLADLLSISQPF